VRAVPDGGFQALDLLARLDLREAAVQQQAGLVRGIG
jgi:hypothetical protein